MSSKTSARVKHIDFIVADIVGIEVALWSAILLWYDRLAMFFDFYKKLSILLAGIYIVVMLFGALHKDILKRGYLRELWMSGVMNTELIFCIVGVLFILKKSEPYSRITFVTFYVLSVILVWIFRAFLKMWIKNRFKKGKNNANVLVVTCPEAAESFMQTLNKENNGYYTFKGLVFPDTDAHEEFAHLPVVREDEMLDFIKDNAINDVFIFLKSGKSSALVEEFLSMGINTHLVLNLEIEDLPNAQMEQIEDYSVVTTSISRASAGELIIKRLFDIFVSIVGLIATGILFIIFAPLIKMQSPGPVFFSQKRVGKNGKIFKIYKFRSMYTDAEERKKELMDQNQMQGLMFKMDNDPRIFPLGKFIRKTSIDEFPQFWNIFKGDMSLVGTRPPTLDEYKQYDPHHLSRLAIKPGLTGMWQTSGRSEITDFEEIVRLDNEYIRNFSLALDIKLLFKTFVTVLGMKGSK
ncbi:exopolysaccharide biosynthesis polyprenyl glycosylphosphotransferase [Ruminococcaceae bacterium KH2T8]|nr:exopolysaccharide biosynthesis polyprenyl glycosylphosphotransferase [Ruminococcaceae bacterium KH2T8]